MEMKFFGPIETKSFNFLRIIINGGQGGCLSGPADTPLDPPLLYVLSCQVQRCYHMLFYKYWICTGQDNTYYLWFK